MPVCCGVGLRACIAVPAQMPSDRWPLLPAYKTIPANQLSFQSASPSRRICPTSPLLAPAWQSVLLPPLPPCCRRCCRAAAGRAHHACGVWQAA